MRSVLAAFVAVLIAVSAQAADAPPDLQAKIEHARQFRAMTIKRLVAGKFKPDSPEAKQIDELLSGGLPYFRMAPTDLKTGSFGELYMRPAIVHKVIDSTTMIIVPVVTRNVVTSGKLGAGGGNQLLIDGASQPLVIHGFSTADIADGSEVTGKQLGVLEVAGTEKVTLRDGKPITAFSLRPFDPKQLAPFIGRPDPAEYAPPKK